MKKTKRTLSPFTRRDSVINESDLSWEQGRSFASKLSGFDSSNSIKKLLVANRGEIAIRVIRAAHDLGLRTTSIYSIEDKFELHRYASDESYIVGEGRSPVSAYLDQEDIIRIALENSVDAIHPGYGFLSENAEFARKVEEAGILFVGPSSRTIELLGDKISAREAAIACGVPVIPGTDGPCKSKKQAVQFAKKYKLPVMLKAAFGGGGRGIRKCTTLLELEQGYDSAVSEALNAFGDGTVFVEKCIEMPRHIEVQILGDTYGNIIHLFERDCSVQRRHQKVVEIAPAQNLSSELRQSLVTDALKLAKHVNYKNAGTVEFLVSGESYYFIEVNPRVQVEHTVTETVTGVDIVQSQIQIAAGASLSELGLEQSKISYRGCAIQVRITTEDPFQNFRPDTGRLQVYRTSGGPGIRLDSSSTAGRVISPHYDSLLVKVTAFHSTFEQTVARLVRAIVEFRIRGVKTNVIYLQRLLVHPDFLANKGTHTSFIDEHPELFNYVPSSNRANKVLRLLSENIVNGVDLPNPDVEIPDIDPVPPVSPAAPKFKGWRPVLLEEGPKRFAQAIREHRNMLITDTTWRDAHQSLLATRVRTIDILKIAPFTACVFSQLFSLEMWGGATFDVCLRFLHENPWTRLRLLREAVPDIPFQMLLRGANGVGYTSYPDNVIYEFVRLAHVNGIDVFRIFDSLNYIENLKLGINAVLATNGGVAEACICYTADVQSSKKYNLEYYMRLVRELVGLGTHIIGIKDMAGLLRPGSARVLVSAIRAEFPDIPIHVHSHDTAGTAVATLLACVESGADIVDCAIDSLSGLTSQASMGAVVNAFVGSDLAAGIRPFDLSVVNDYWEKTRGLYAAFESPYLKSGNTDVYLHEMPGGQMTNLQFQAHKMGLGERWFELKKKYRDANMLLGDIVKVTPSSKVVGDLALFMLQNDLSPEDVVEDVAVLSFPKSVLEYFYGYLGEPYGGFPEPLTSRIRKAHPPKDGMVMKGRPGALLPPMDLAALKDKLISEHGLGIEETDVASAALYPTVFQQYREFIATFGQVWFIPSRYYWKPVKIGESLSLEIEKGKVLYLKALAVTNEKLDTSERDIYWEVNGTGRTITVVDKSFDGEKQGRGRQKCDPSDKGSVGASMGGVVVDVRVKVKQRVKAGDPLFVLSAMKMETVVACPVNGVVSSVNVKLGDSIDAGDLLCLVSSK